MQINAVIVYSNLSIETIFPCIPKKVREEVDAYSKGGGLGGGRFFDIMNRE